MAWSTPRTWVAGELVTASVMNAHLRDQLNALDDRAYMKHGSGWISAPSTWNTSNQAFTNTTEVLLTTGGSGGTIYARVVSQVNVSAAGTGVTSFNVRSQGLVEAASGASGAVATNIPIYTPTAITGALTTGWKYFDSNWVALSALATDLSAYGWAVIRPLFRLDHNGSVAPTVANVATTIALRVA